MPETVALVIYYHGAAVFYAKLSFYFEEKVSQSYILSAWEKNIVLSKYISYTLSVQ